MQTKHLFCQFVIVMVLLLTLGTVGVLAQVEFINIATGSAGGTYFPIGTAIANLWNQEVDNIRASAMESPGSVTNVVMLRDGEADFAITMCNVADAAFHGRGDYEGNPNKGFRAVTALWPNVVHIQVLPEIKDIMDLAGKRYSMGPTGSGVGMMDSPQILGTFGLFGEEQDDIANVIPEYVPYQESTVALQNRRVAGATNVSYPPAGTVSELLASTDCHLLSITQEQIAKLQENYSHFFEYTITAGTYPNQDEDVHTLGYANYFSVRADMSEDLVYTLTKTLFENVEKIYSVHPATRDIKLDNATVGVGIDFHEGAIRYYKEVGIWKD